jgi:hypothetical protein
MSRPQSHMAVKFGAEWSDCLFPLAPKGRVVAKCFRMFAVMKAKPVTPFDVICPDCGAILKVDPETKAILSHTSAPRKRTFEDFEAAAKAMREQDVRKEDIFRQSVEAEKNKQQLFDKRFEEALRKAKESPDEGRPLREFDLD